MLVYHMSGFTHDDVYTMPIYLRRFYWNQLVEQRTKENKEQEKAAKQQQSQMPKMPKIK